MKQSELDEINRKLDELKDITLQLAAWVTLNNRKIWQDRLKTGRATRRQRPPQVSAARADRH